MKILQSRLFNRVKDGMAQVLIGPQMLAFLPALTLGTFWFGGETALIIVALGLPLLFAALGGFSDLGITFGAWTQGTMEEADLEDRIKSVFNDTRDGSRRSALFVLEIDEFDDLVSAHGREIGDLVMECSLDRVSAWTRNRDAVAQVAHNQIAICITPVPHLDLELCIQMAGRLQSAIEEPIAVGGGAVFVTCSIGLCQRSRAPAPDAAAWYQAATTALANARAVGAAAIRTYAGEMALREHSSNDLVAEASAALENGLIQAWFQPQINTDTGRVSGFETLARWSHPVRGMISPAEFLPALEQAGLMQKLSQQMIEQSLTALKSWDAAGITVPSVGVNFATDELRDPGLLNRIRWELDRFGLTPDRLTVEVLETVMTDQPDEVVARNITALSELGCKIDLDDFGTGHASIASVRRFRVARIKIDRSFVTKADHDPEQQKLIAAILTMAERLDLETLAEGVETTGEHALLAQLGCNHVQGFGIGRPMPFDQTLDWVVAHEAKLQDAPQIGRQT